MSRPLDPENTDSLALTMRITRPLADALDAELARFTGANPGVSASRATIARIALMRAFLPTGTVLASASAPAPLVAVAPVAAPAAPEVPAVAVAPAALAPVTRAERAERAPRVVSVPVAPLAVDPRQLAIPVTAANDTPASASTPAHESLRTRYTDARILLGFTHDDATRALAAAGMPVENLRRELAAPTAQWTTAHDAALAAWLDTIEARGVPISSEPAAAPRRARGKAVATPENDALRARYCAALAAKRLTNEPTAKLVGCSEATLRQWKNGEVKNLGGDKDPEGKWLAALTGILDALPSPLE